MKRITKTELKTTSQSAINHLAIAIVVLAVALVITAIITSGFRNGNKQTQGGIVPAVGITSYIEEEKDYDADSSTGQSPQEEKARTSITCY